MSEDKKEIRPVVRGKIHEKGLGEKMAESFFSEDTKTVGDYILWDVIIPGLKNAVIDVMEMALFGSSRSRKNRTSGGRTSVSYSSYYDSDSRSFGPRNVGRPNRSSVYNFSDIELSSRGDAEEVITSMEELVNRYGVASVADLCSLVGVSSQFTDNNFGWTDIRDFSYRRKGGVYILDFANPISLK